MEKCDVFLVLIVVGLLGDIGQGYLVAKDLELSGHRSSIYLSQKDGSKNGVCYIFERISQNTCVYALLNYNQNFSVAKSTKCMLEKAIRSKVEENGEHNKIDWKSFLKTQLTNIQNMKNKPDEMELTIEIVIVDKFSATTAELMRRSAISHKGVKITNIDNKYILLQYGFWFGRILHERIQNELDNKAIWGGAAQMFIDSILAHRKEERDSYGVIIIDLNGVPPEFEFSELSLNFHGYPLVEKSMELNDHRSGIIISQEDGSEQGILYMFEKITDEIGAYGLFRYDRNFALVVKEKNLLESAIRDKIRETPAYAQIDWRRLFKIQFGLIENVCKIQGNNTLTVSIVIVDRKTVTKAQLVSGEFSNSTIETFNKEEYSRRNRFISIKENGFESDKKDQVRVRQAFKDAKIREKAAEMVTPKNENENEPKGTITIDFGSSWMGHH